MLNEWAGHANVATVMQDEALNTESRLQLPELCDLVMFPSGPLLVMDPPPKHKTFYFVLLI